MLRFVHLALVATVVGRTAPLVAQGPLSFGVAGGVTAPQGFLTQTAHTGWHLTGTAALSGVMQPLGARLDLSYHRLGFAGFAGGQTFASLTANVTYRLPMTNSPFSPYAITGVGFYRQGCNPDSSCRGAPRFGWNAGLGTKLRIMGFKTFFEARFHQAGGRGNFIPISVGIIF
jgi:hypothetical protein